MESLFLNIGSSIDKHISSFQAAKSGEDTNAAHKLLVSMKYWI